MKPIGTNHMFSLPSLQLLLFDLRFGAVLLVGLLLLAAEGVISWV